MRREKHNGLSGVFGPIFARAVSASTVPKLRSLNASLRTSR